MGQLIYGRYFILEEDIDGLYTWARAKLSSPYIIKNYGLCPIRKEMIIASLFESGDDFRDFEADYLNQQINNSVIYTTRRNPSFVCNSEEDRRRHVELRRIDALTGEDRRIH
jgi:hypothetical protein